MKFSTLFLVLFLLNINSFSQGIIVTANTSGTTVPIHDFLGLNSTVVNKPGLGFDNPTIINDLGRQTHFKLVW